MTTYNTGNPVGSAAVKDLFDNAENLDRLVNDEAVEVWDDRLGRPRKTWHGIEKQAQLDIDEAAAAAATAAAIEATAAAEGYRDEAELARDAAGQARDAAENARDDAVAAAGAVGPLEFYDAYAQALAAAAGARRLVEVAQDETREGSRTRYWAEAGALDFLVNLDRLRVDITQPTGSNAVGGLDLYAKLDLYTGPATRIQMLTLGIKGWWKKTNSGKAPTVGTVRADGNGNIWERQYKGDIRESWFKNISTDNDSLSLSRALEFASSSTVTDSYPGQSLVGGCPDIALDTRIYDFPSPVNIPFWMRLKANQAILRAPMNGKIFTSTTAYRISIDDARFFGDDVTACEVIRANIDNARYEFNRCEFSTHTRTIGRYAVRISSRSGCVYMNDCDVQAAPNYIDTTGTDFCNLDGGWVNGYSPKVPGGKKPENTASIINGSREMKIFGTIFIPETDGSGITPKVRWIDNYGALGVFGAHFGGENGGFPIVWQYLSAEQDVHPFVNYAHVSFNSCQLAAGAGRVGGGVVCLMPGVIPGRYAFVDNHYIVDAPLITSRGYDFTKTEAETNEMLRAALYAASNRARIDQVKITALSNLTERIPACLSPFVEDHPDSGGQPSAVSGGVYDAIDVIRISVGAGSQRASASFELTVDVWGGYTGGVLQQSKTYSVVVLFDSGGSPFVKISQTRFDEFLIGSATSPGVELISLTKNASSTSAGATFSVNVAASPAVSNMVLGWSINTPTIYKNSTGITPFVQIRNY